LSIEISNQKIDKVKCTKFLGLYIDDELLWKYHIDQITTKLSKMTGIMARKNIMTFAKFRDESKPLFLALVNK